MARPIYDFGFVGSLDSVYYGIALVLSSAALMACYAAFSVFFVWLL
jgi:hypothetical protein